MKTTKMKIEIWSDVMCPFCYIGKRKFEPAFKQFDYSSHTEIAWKIPWKNHSENGRMKMHHL